MKQITEINLDEKYTPKIKGLGELYEIAAVSYCQKLLQKKYPTGRLFLSSNFDHSKRGITLLGLDNLVNKKGYRVLEKGYTDSFLFPSCPRPNSSVSPLLKPTWLPSLAGILFWLLVRLEFIWKNKKRSHMVYVFGEKIKYNQKTKYG